MFNTKGTHGYEKTTWDLYTDVTRQKKEYYKIRQENWDPIILNAYVTFRDIQARNKAVELFSRNPVRKFLAKTSKCLSKIYPDDYKISEHKACLSAQAAVDPETIVWENLGTPAPIKKESLGCNDLHDLCLPDEFHRHSGNRPLRKRAPQLAQRGMQRGVLLRNRSGYR